MLEPFELSPGEELLYLALVDVPTLTTTDLAKLAHSSPEGVVALLAPLEAAGLVSRLPGAPSVAGSAVDPDHHGGPQPPRYAAIEPGIGFATLLAAQEQRVRRAEEQAQLAQAAAEQLAERFRLRGARHPIDLIEVVVGNEAILQRLYQLERTVRGELRGIDMPPYFMTHNDAEADLLSQGATSRWLYDSQVLDRPGKLEEISRFSDIGEQGRIIQRAPFKMLIADDQLGLIALTDESRGAHSALMVGPSALLDGLIRVFEGLWRFAVPLQPTAPEPAADLPSEQESQLLALLAVGRTDKTIARQLGLGLRTVQKRVQKMMERLDVETRFQAGVQAKARGWL